MEDAAPSKPKLDNSSPEEPMEDDPEFENEEGEESTITKMAEERTIVTDLDDWFYQNVATNDAPPKELIIQDIIKHGPDSSGLYLIGERELQNLIDSGKVDEDLMHYYQNAQEEMRVELANIQEEDVDHNEFSAEDQAYDNDQCDDDMINDDGALSTLTMASEISEEESVTESNDITMRVVELCPQGTEKEVIDAIYDAWEELGPYQGSSLRRLMNDPDFLPDELENYKAAGGQLVYAEGEITEEDLAEMQRAAGIQVNEDEFDDEDDFEDEEEASDEKMVDIGDVDDVLDAQDDFKTLDKDLGEPQIGDAPENVDELIAAIIDAQALGMSQAKAQYSDDMLIQMSPERIKSVYSRVMGESLEEDEVEEGVFDDMGMEDPDTSWMDKYKRVTDAPAEQELTDADYERAVEIFRADPDGLEKMQDYFAPEPVLDDDTPDFEERYLSDPDVVRDILSGVDESYVPDSDKEGHFDGKVDCETEFDDSCFKAPVDEDLGAIDPDIEAAILDLARKLGLEDADQDDAAAIGKKLDVSPSDVHKVINQDLTQESKK